MLKKLKLEKRVMVTNDYVRTKRWTTFPRYGSGYIIIDESILNKTINKLEEDKDAKRMSSDIPNAINYLHDSGVCIKKIRIFPKDRNTDYYTLEFSAVHTEKIKDLAEKLDLPLRQEFKEESETEEIVSNK